MRLQAREGERDRIQVLAGLGAATTGGGGGGLLRGATREINLVNIARRPHRVQQGIVINVLDVGEDFRVEPVGVGGGKGCGLKVERFELRVGAEAAVMGVDIVGMKRRGSGVMEAVKLVVVALVEDGDGLTEEKVAVLIGGGLFSGSMRRAAKSG